jgi:hypothetical protein
MKKYSGAGKKGLIGSFRKVTDEASDSNSLSNWVREGEKSCYVCNHIKNNYERYVATFLVLFKRQEADFMELVKKGKGFCLSHLADLLDVAPKYLNEKEQKQHEPLKDYFELTEIEKKGKSYISSTFTSYNISIAFASNYNHENISPLNLEIKDYSSPKLLCDRRYDNFSSLYNYLIKEFPDSIYPKLSEKNYLSFFGSSAVFLNRRLKQLKFLLNYLLNYEDISSSKGFIKFLKDPEFDNEFFKNPTLWNLLLIIALIVLLVQLIQIFGQNISKKIDKRRK